MRIYTKTGDKGTTSLFDGNRVAKDDIRVESYGTIDELGSFMGLAKNYVEDNDIKELIENIQNKLFTLASNLATEDEANIKFHIVEDDIVFLEGIIDKYMNLLDSPMGFIVPGSNTKSAYLHVARTVCRRAERRIISLSKLAIVDPLLIKYVNRLSDCLYALARFLG
ncbi:cob(I)yrinic acid a,c-diamide adenosyltransferase [Tissierella creatinini]|nr:cob(I)yrinic acid a,c-diamide adenosyltransferase [Tissierella creatinini]TJX62399.1 cob(I)yrinic acid a,c-diamide adenosyltransferase [Soehngenia saccharolytica]